MLILTEIVAQYQKNYLQKLDDELNYYKSLNLIDCINYATRALGRTGKKHSHQRRLEIIMLQKMAEILAELENEISQMINFDELHNLIKKKAIKRFGVVAIYDTTLRIGYHLGIFPTCVYLHAGVREGAEKLLGVSNKTISIKLEDMPEELKTSNAYHIENLLCIYKTGKLHKDKHKAC